MTNKHKRDDWGELSLRKVCSGEDFISLSYELLESGSGFINNMPILLEAYRDGNLYTLEVAETDSMYKRSAGLDAIFVKGPYSHPSDYLLPCFCIIDGNKCVILWVDERARRMGFGSTLVKKLNIKSIFNPSEESEPFWRALGLMK